MIRALIADDEAPARAKLRRLLAAERGVEVVAEAEDGEAAVAAIRSHHPDLVFLDVQMPRRDGFEVIAEIGVAEMPLIVFVTAYDEHALRAFEVHALDYLLKPFAPSRFVAVLERARRRLDAPGEGLAARIARLLDDARPGRWAERLLARKGEEREVFVPVGEIDVIRADGNYVRLLTARGELRRRETLGGLAARLDPDRFLQINRSEIVRLDAIAEVQPWFHGDHRVVLRDGKVLSWSRRFRKRTEGEL